MSAHEHIDFEQVSFQYEEVEPEEIVKPTVTCKFCNQTGFEWLLFHGRWTLFDSHRLPHQCLKEKAAAKKKNPVKTKNQETTIDYNELDKINRLLKEESRNEFDFIVDDSDLEESLEIFKNFVDSMYKL